MLKNNREDLCPITIRRYLDKEWSNESENVAREVPVTVRWNDGNCESRLWAWPFSLEYLAIGHAALAQQQSARLPGYTATVAKISDDMNGHAYSVSLHAVERTARASMRLPAVKADTLLRTMQAFIEDIGLWHATGCFHRAGVFSPRTNSMLYATEDIGRHNCLDRLAGWALQHDTCLSGCILFMSARVTASICSKAIKSGFRFIVSCSAVSSAAIEMAREHRVILVGFSRPQEKRLNLYTEAYDNLLLD